MVTAEFDSGIELRLGRQRVLVERVHQAPKADPIAVVAPGIDVVADGLVRRRDRRAFARAVAKHLDIVGNIDSEPCAVRPFVSGAQGQGRIGIAGLAFKSPGLAFKSHGRLLTG